MDRTDRDRWNRRYAERGDASRAPGPYIESLADRLPTSGRALDVAGGAGRHALWLSARGLDVTLVDVSDVALRQAEAAARDAGLALRTVALDLEECPPPQGPWSIVLCTHYLNRPLMTGLAAELEPGGVIVWVQPTVINLERNEHPRRRFLAAPGELAEVLRKAPVPLQIEFEEEGWVDDGDAKSQHLARVVARRGQ